MANKYSLQYVCFSASEAESEELTEWINLQCDN